MRGNRLMAPKRSEEPSGLLIVIALSFAVLAIGTACLFLARGHSDTQLEEVRRLARMASANHVEAVTSMVSRVDSTWQAISHDLSVVRNATAHSMQDVRYLREVVKTLRAANEVLDKERQEREAALQQHNAQALQDIKKKMDTPDAAVMDLVTAFVASIEEQDLAPVFTPELVPEKDVMAVNLRQFAATGDCNLIPTMIGYVPSNTTDGVHLIVQYPVLEDIGGDGEDDNLLLGRFYGAYADKDEDMPPRLDQMHKIAKFQAKDFRFLGKAWLEKRGRNQDDRLLDCFAREMLQREERKRREDVVLWRLVNGEQTHGEVRGGCAGTSDDVSIGVLQQLADLLVKPNRKTYMWWGRDQLRFYARRKAQERGKEFEDVLRWNICHPGVKEVHLLVESDAVSAVAAEKTATYNMGHKVKRRVVGRRMHYQDAWAYTSELTGPVVVTNSDVIIGEGLHELVNTTLNGRAFALSRHEAVTSTLATHVCCSDAYDGCHDSFMLNAPAPPALAQATDFQQNIWQAENVMIMELCRVALHVTNPCANLKLYHYHNSNFRPRQNRGHMSREIKTCGPGEGLANPFNCC